MSSTGINIEITGSVMGIVEVCSGYETPLEVIERAVAIKHKMDISKTVARRDRRCTKHRGKWHYFVEEVGNGN